jgi:quinohemoprotein ethanol dehydrogenase
MKFTENVYPGTVYTFKLGGDAPMPDFPDTPVQELVSLDFEASPEQLKNGEALYGRYCSACHGGGDYPSGGIMPNLPYSAIETFEIFHEIVGEGLYLPKGMPNFGDRLGEQDITDIKNYIGASARELSAANQ